MKKIIIVSISILLFILFAIIPVNTMILSNQQENIMVHPFFKEESFSIRWTHSVEKEDWEEFFHVKNNEIILTSTRFKTFGAGVPDDAGEETYIKDGWVYMTKIHQVIGSTLRLQTGKDTNHRFRLNEKTTSFDPQHSYQISVRTVPIYKLIYMIAKD